MKLSWTEKSMREHLEELGHSGPNAVTEFLLHCGEYGVDVIDAIDSASRPGRVEGDLYAAAFADQQEQISGEYFSETNDEHVMLFELDEPKRMLMPDDKWHGFKFLVVTHDAVGFVTSGWMESYDMWREAEDEAYIQDTESTEEDE